jgi:hypothetical protein
MACIGWATNSNLRESALIVAPGAGPINLFHWYLENYPNCDSYTFAPYDFLKPAISNDCFTWGLVRNPYDRAVGWYYLYGVFLRYHSVINPIVEFEFSMWRKGFDVWLRHFAYSANYIIDSLIDDTGHTTERFAFVFNQCQWFTNDLSRSKPCIDKIVKFEEFDKELPEIKEILGITEDVNIYDSTDFSLRGDDFGMTSGSKKIIEEIFASDFEYFNY